jgi:hypothetical protein
MEPPAPTDLPARVRELLAIAERAGAPAAWLAETSAALIEALLEREELRRAIGAERLKRTRAAHALRALAEERRAAGYTAGEVIAAVMAAQRVSRATAYRRLSQASETTPGLGSPRSPHGGTMKSSKYISPKNATGPNAEAATQAGQGMPGPISPAHSKPSYSPAPVPREQNDKDNTQTSGNFEMPENAVGAGFPQKKDTGVE